MSVLLKEYEKSKEGLKTKAEENIRSKKNESPDYMPSNEEDEYYINKADISE